MIRCWGGGGAQGHVTCLWLPQSLPGKHCAVNATAVHVCARACRCIQQAVEHRIIPSNFELDSAFRSYVFPCAGALPDQLEFSKDCRTILVANEGEPNTYEPPSLENDPEGSVSVINLCACDGDR